MNRIDEIKQRILDTKVARQMLKLDEYDEVIDDFEYLLSTIQQLREELLQEVEGHTHTAELLVQQRKEAMQERELSESIVAEREQLYIEVEEMKNKQAEMVREFWLIYSVTNNGSRANKRAHKAFQTFKPHDEVKPC